MKKTTTIIFALLMAINLFSQGDEQSGSKYTKMDLFSPSWEPATKSYSSNVTEGAIFDFDIQKALAFLESNPHQFSLELPTGESGNTMILKLTRSKIFAPDFMVYTSENGKTQFDYIGGLHYQGYVEGYEKSLAAISVFDNEVMGLISTTEGNYNLGKLGDSEKAHILYLDKDLINPPDFDCYTEDDGIGYTTEQLTFSPENVGDCVRIYIEGDQTLFTNLGSAAAVTNLLTGVFNQSAVLYLNEGINIVISEIFVWTTVDPYTGPTALDYRNQFQANTGAFNGDLGHLVALANIGGIAAGFAGICNANTDESLCFSGFSGTGFNIVPLYSFNVFIITHEMGHLFGSRHTHACVWNGNNTAIDGCAGYVEGTCALPGSPVGGGTIMSYCHNDPVGIDFTQGFGPQPQAVILNSVANATCLSPCGTNEWTGASNSYWNNDANWTLGHSPTAGENIVLTNSGFQPVRVTTNNQTCDNLTIDPGVILEIYASNMNVAGELDNNGTIIFNSAADLTAMGFSNVGGIIQMNNGSFMVTELTDDGVYGTWNITYGTIVLNQTTGFPDINGTINMSGGSMTVSDLSSCIWGYGAPANVTMSGGVLDFPGSGLSIADGFTITENITGGIIRTASNLSVQNANFTPTGGTLELYGPNDAPVNHTAGSIYNLNINKGSATAAIVFPETWEDRDGNTMMMAPMASSAYPTSTLNIQGDLTITSGLFHLNGQTVNVGNDMTVYGTFQMNNAADVLNVGIDPYDNLAFGNGSFGDLSAGVVNLASWVWIQPGGLITATTGNTMNFIGPGISGIDVEESGTHLGNINVVAISPFRLFDIGGFPIEVDGNFNLQAGSNMDFQNRSMIVHGTFTDDPTSTMYIYDGPIANGNGSSLSADDKTVNQNSEVVVENQVYEGAKGPKGGGFELDNSFTLNGLMDVGDGDVLIHGNFSTAPTGTLTINGGTVICDAPSGTDIWYYLDGTFNMTSGLFEISNNSINFGATATTNISGGILRSGGSFSATSPGIFQPSGGILEVVGSATDNFIECSNGNYLYDIFIDRPVGFTEYFLSEIVIQNDLTIQSGVLNPGANNIYVGGDWTNNVGTVGFIPGTGTVVFNQDGGIQFVNGENTFYNVQQDKVGAGSNLQFMGPTTILGDMTLNHFTFINDVFDVQGTLNLNNPASKFTANIDGMGTITNLSQGGAVVANGGTIDFLDLVEPGIYGTVNVMNGTLNFFQDAAQYPDVNAAIDISGGVLNYTAGGAGCVIAYDGPASITMSGGEFNFINGYVGIFDGSPFSENISGGVISIDIWFDAQHTAFTPTGGTVLLNGGSDGGLSMIPGANFFNVEINKSGGKSASFQYNDRFENLMKGIKANTIGLGSDVDILGDFTVNAGLFTMSNYTANVSGNTIVNTGGTLSVNDGGTLAMGSGSSINVNSGGILLATGVSGSPATITGIGGIGTYAFNIFTGGTMGAEWAIFEYMSANGVYLQEGSFVDPLFTFDNCIFRNGAPATSALMVINNDAVFTCNDAYFENTSGTTSYNVWHFYDTGEVNFVNATGLFAGEDYDYDPHNKVHWTTGLRMDLTLLLEGPYNDVTNLMDIDLNTGGYIPLSQPYNPALPYYGNPAPVWLYPGTENVVSIPPNAVDWVIVQLRDATSPANASSATILDTQAAFVLDDGTIVGLDGVNQLVFPVLFVNDIYVAVYHRNHLGILSNFPLSLSGGAYTYDFSSDETQVYGGANGHKELEPGVWGMVAADGDANGLIQLTDSQGAWTDGLGLSGYLGGDFNMNSLGQISDKQDVWLPNLGNGGQVPAKGGEVSGYASQIPK